MLVLLLLAAGWVAAMRVARRRNLGDGHGRHVLGVPMAWPAPLMWVGFLAGAILVTLALDIWAR